MITAAQSLLQTGRQRQELENRTQLRIPKPLGVTQLQTTVTTIYTAGDAADFEIGGLIASNVTGGASTITIYFVPPAGTAGTANAVAVAVALAANSVTRLSQFDGMILRPGAFIQALCGANDAVNLTGWGYDYQGAYA